MGKLVVTANGSVVQELELDQERTTIGRKPSNDIPLDDKAVSGTHAVIITIGSDSFLEDLDSTNGTVVNGKQISKHPLSDGDVITLGGHALKYEGEAGAEGDLEKTMILSPGDMTAARAAAVDAAAAVAKATPRAPTPPPAAAAAAAAPIKPPLGKLQVLSGGNSGKELQLTKALTTIGKPGVQVAAITRRIDGYYIVHVGAQGDPSKRPLLNGQPIPQQAQKLSDSDTIELAGTSMMFSIVDAGG